MRALATNFGTEVESNDVGEWMAKGKLDWQIATRPVYVDDQELEDKVALVNNKSGKVLSLVSPKYQVVQPEAMLETFQNAVHDYGFRMDRVGMYEGGKVIWGRADMEQSFLLNGNDEIDYYMYFVTSADGSSATHAFISTMRAVCMNALNLAIKGALKYSITHREQYEPAEFRNRAQFFQAGVHDFEDNVQLLEQTPISGAGEFVELYSQFFGRCPKDASSRQKTQYETRVTEFWQHTKNGVGAELARRKLNYWNFLNAYTWQVDHESRCRSDELAHRNSIMRNAASKKVEIMEGLVDLAKAA